MNATRIQRLNYIYLLLMICFVFPVLLSSILSMFEMGVVSTSVASGQLGGGANITKFSISFDDTYRLLITIPIHLFLTLRRVKDIGWHPALSLVLGLPIINFLAWFWPGSENENKYGGVPEPARKGVKIFVFGFPVWAVLISMLALKFGMIGAGLWSVDTM